MSPLAQAIITAIQTRPRLFSELADQHRNVPWPEFLRAWGEVRPMTSLKRDEDGRYLIGEGDVLAPR
jgi:hypothetical protein